MLAPFDASCPTTIARYAVMMSASAVRSGATASWPGIEADGEWWGRIDPPHPAETAEAEAIRCRRASEKMALSTARSRYPFSHYLLLARSSYRLAVSGHFREGYSKKWHMAAMRWALREYHKSRGGK